MQNEEIKADEVEMEFSDNGDYTDVNYASNLNVNERVKPVINKFDNKWVPGGKYASGVSF